MIHWTNFVISCEQFFNVERENWNLLAFKRILNSSFWRKKRNKLCAHEIIGALLLKLEVKLKENIVKRHFLTEISSGNIVHLHYYSLALSRVTPITPRPKIRLLAKYADSENGFIKATERRMIQLPFAFQRDETNIFNRFDSIIACTINT